MKSFEKRVERQGAKIAFTGAVETTDLKLDMKDFDEICSVPSQRQAASGPGQVDAADPAVDVPLSATWSASPGESDRGGDQSASMVSFSTPIRVVEIVNHRDDLGLMQWLAAPIFADAQQGDPFRRT